MAELDSMEWIEMAIFDATSLNGTYQVMNGAAQQSVGGAVGFENDIKILVFYNDGDTAVTISFDSVKPHLFLPSKGTEIIDVQAAHMDNSAYSSGRKYGRKGQLVWGTGTAATSGNIYISGMR